MGENMSAISNRTGMTRRETLAGLSAASALAFAGPARAQWKGLIAYVGCRTTKERNARGEGIGVFRMDQPTGASTPIQLLKDIVNPS
jgi:6-phosphogluconolactonase